MADSGHHFRIASASSQKGSNALATLINPSCGFPSLSEQPFITASTNLLKYFQPVGHIAGHAAAQVHNGESDENLDQEEPD